MSSKKSPSIKKGDTVKVIAGTDKGAQGKVIKVLRDSDRVIVEGVNLVKRHTKVLQQGGRAGNTGGIITPAAPEPLSDAMVVWGGQSNRHRAHRVGVEKRRRGG